MCVLRVEEQISVQPPTRCSGGGARSELFIPHGDSRLWALVRSRPCCIWILGFNKRSCRLEGDDIYELARAKTRANGARG